MRISASAPVDSSEASPSDADAHVQTTPAASSTFKSAVGTTARGSEPTRTRLVTIFRSKQVLKELASPREHRRAGAEPCPAGAQGRNLAQLGPAEARFRSHARLNRRLDQLGQAFIQRPADIACRSGAKGSHQGFGIVVEHPG